MMKHLIVTMGFILALFVWTKGYPYKPGDKVVLYVSSGCEACWEAEQALENKHIPYSTKQGSGFVPKLYVNGKYMGLGSGVVIQYANS